MMQAMHILLNYLYSISVNHQHGYKIKKNCQNILFHVNSLWKTDTCETCFSVHFSSCLVSLWDPRHDTDDRIPLAAKEPFIIEQLICGILWIVLLNCVIQSLFLKIA